MAMPRKRPFENPNQYYSYLWALDGEAIYVGYGHNSRCRPGSSLGGRSAALIDLLKQRQSEIDIFVFEAASREDAKKDERMLLSVIKTSYNAAPGCGGYSGMHTKRDLANMRAANLGRKHAEEFKAAISARLIGNKHLLGHVHSEATRKKLSIAGKGRYPSLLTRQKASERAKFRNLHNPPRKGAKLSDETKLKLSIALKAARERKRNALHQSP